MVRRFACLFLLLSACEQSQPGNPVAHKTSADVNDAIPVQPDPATGSDGPYHGTIAGLRQLGAKSGLKVTIDKAAITGISGNSKTVYASDPEGGAFSGILIQLCDSKSGVCATGPTGGGLVYGITGTFLITTDGEHMSIGTPTLTATSDPAVAVPPYFVNPTALAETATNNADARGVYVNLDLRDGPAVITSVTPASMTNSSYSADMEAACRGDGVPQDTAKCCPSTGPKFFGLEVTVNGAVIAVSTSNYPSKKNNQFGASLIVWPCNGDFTTSLKTGQSFSSLGGIFDLNYGSASLTPATPSDVALSN